MAEFKGHLILWWKSLKEIGGNIMAKTILSMKNVTKRYPGVTALNKVSVDFQEGEVHALLGENGAGKSTLIKVLSGAITNDEGTIEIDNQIFEKMTPKYSREHGVEVIYQEYNLVNALTVAENISLGFQKRGFVDYKAMDKITNDIFKPYGIDIDPRARVKDLSPAYQQLVEIAKAISKNSKIIVMDEPTAQLTVSEVESLYSIIRELKKRKTTIIYISHRMEEIFEITDRVTVMRDGEYIDTINTKDTNRQELINLMVGRELNEKHPTRDGMDKDDVVLEVKNLTGVRNEGVSFKLRKGEILGFSGLVGAGRTELVRAIFGADKKSSGEIYVKGEKVKIKSPTDAISYGIGLVPEDRKMQGCFLSMTIEWNMAITNIKELSKGNILNFNRIAKQAEIYKEKLRIKASSIHQKVGNLSGGNQQKVVVAKVLAGNSDIVIFDEPTRGIDVGARQEIYGLMNELTKEGKSIIMISSDMEELLGMSDRIIVLCEGKVAGEIEKENFAQNLILEMASID